MFEAVIMSRGVVAGDSVAILLRNDIPFFVVTLATRTLGAYAVPSTDTGGPMRSSTCSSTRARSRRRRRWRRDGRPCVGGGRDELLAQQVGLPGVFSMGMMQGGMLAHLVAYWLGIANVRRFSIRFEECVWSGDEFTFTGRVVAVEVACHTGIGTRALSGTAVPEYPA